MDKNDYNFLASYYVFVRNIVFGAKTENAYEYYLDYVKSGDKVLIVGGGAGKILSNSHLSKESIIIDYVDSSIKMIKIARKRESAAQVNFICSNVLNFIPAMKYDVIILPFILDVFNEPNLIEVIKFVQMNIVKEGIIIVSDFAPPSRFFQKILLGLMFLFFRITTNIESASLLKIEDYLDSTPLKKLAKVDFQKGFIFSAVYKKV